MRKLTDFVRRGTEKIIDNVVADVLARVETNAIRPWIARMRGRATRDFSIGATLLLLALGAHVFMAGEALPTALVAAACWYSIVVFVWNRVNDVRTYLAHRRPIGDLVRVAWPAWIEARLGKKLHTAGEAIYDAIYEGRLTFENAQTGTTFQVGGVVRGAHRVTSALGLTPSKAEVFEQVYAQMLSLFGRVMRSQAAGIVGFLLGYAVLTSVIRVVVENVVSGIHLSGAFDPIVFPLVYVANLLTSAFS